MSSKSLIIVLRAALCIVAISSLGCSGKCSVAGSVKFADKPLVMGTVSVVDSDGIALSGDITPEGTYRVDGLATGPAKVYVQNQIGKSRSRDGKSGSAKPPPGWFEIPARYTDPNASDLTLKLESGVNTFNIEMK